MNERQKSYFRAKLDGLEKRHPARSPRNTRNPAAGKRQPSRSRRPRIVRDRPRHRAPGPRPPAQADRQDRRRAAPDRGRHLRLLRGDRRADRAQTSRRAPDRHAVDRGARATRASRKSLSRRLRTGTGGAAAFFNFLQWAALPSCVVGADAAADREKHTGARLLGSALVSASGSLLWRRPDVARLRADQPPAQPPARGHARSSPACGPRRRRR